MGERQQWGNFSCSRQDRQTLTKTDQSESKEPQRQSVGRERAGDSQRGRERL